MKNLSQHLYNVTDYLRSIMEVSNYKNYIFGLFFYKYLSDKLLNTVVEVTGVSFDTYDTTNKQTNLYRELLVNSEPDNDITSKLEHSLGYEIHPDLLFNVISELPYHNSFQINSLIEALNYLSKYDLLNGLFDSVELNSKMLGPDKEQREMLIHELIKEMNRIDLLITKDEDKNIGYAFKDLIYRFSSAEGKQGTVHTPPEVSKIMTRIVTIGNEDKKSFSIYDPTMGSGSLMLEVKNYIQNPDCIKYFGQELHAGTFNVAKMNFLMHGINKENIQLNNGDTLDKDWPTHEKYFDSVVMLPPFSSKWSADPSFLNDHRFKPFEKLAPKSKADFAFLLHGFYHLKKNGTMAIVLPHGVLFRGAAEGEIRKKLLEDGNIDAVIGLPANLLSATAIPINILILKKERTSRDVLFIDHSKEFIKERRQNKLSKDDIEKIVSTYIKRESIDKYSRIATYTEIKDNDYNLNIPRYVSSYEDEKPLDIKEIELSIKNNHKKKTEVESNFHKIISEFQLLEERTDLKYLLEMLNMKK